MSDQIFLHLTSGWALGFDPLQWMLMRAKKRREEVYWNPVAFIAIEKRFLLRSLRERNIRPTFEANEYLNAMPSTFREWQHWHKTTHASSQIKAQRNIGILDYLPP